MTRPDAPSGRGRRLTPSAVKELAIQLDIPVATPTTRKELVSIVTTTNPDLIIVVAYGMIFPKSIVDRYFCMNIHGSLLPKYRGASPIQTALLNGDDQTGISLIRMGEKMDAGDILLKQVVDIAFTDTFQDLHDRLCSVSCELSEQFITQFIARSFHLTPQDDTLATYCHKLVADDFQLNPDTMSAEELYRRIRTFSPTPGAYIISNNKRVKIISAQLTDGILTPVIVRPEGKSDMRYQDYLTGNPPLPI